MSDLEIVKALECHTGKVSKRCQVCPYTIYGCYCLDHLHPDLLDLINRLQAENKQWKQEANQYQNWWGEAISRIATAKAEAYKECIEKVKCGILPQLNTSTLDEKEAFYFCLKLLDNLLKELVGE